MDVSLLIPDAIGQQTSGERVKGGALEAFIGALYEISGFEVTQKFVLTLLSEEIMQFDPANNYIGFLQEGTQKRGEHLPVYQETFRSGPDHRPHFTVRVQIADGRMFEGSGRSLSGGSSGCSKDSTEQYLNYPSGFTKEVHFSGILP